MRPDQDFLVEVSGFEPPTSTLRRSWGSPPETAPPAKALVTALPVPLETAVPSLIRCSGVANGVAGRRSAEPEHRRQGVVDAPQLLTTQVASQITEAAGVGRANLFDEHQRRSAIQLDLRSE